MKSSIDKVRSRKKNKALFIDGINYGRVIAMQTYDTSIKSVTKEFIRLFTFDYKIEISGNKNSNICLFYSLRSSKRKDYDYIIDLFKKSITDIKCIDLISYKSFNKILKKLVVLIKNIIRFKLNNVDDVIISSIVATKYIILNEELNKEFLFEDIDLLCTFCDAYGPDNLATQIATNNKITTATLQHGQYRILSTGNEIADAEAYENFISDYMLVWGQATVDEFKKVKINSDRLIKIGALKEFSFNDRMNSYHKTGVFGVVLSGEPYKETNIKMINLANIIAEKYNLKYILRIHPKNNVSLYEKYCKSEYLFGIISNVNNIEYAKKIEFSLIHMTGVFVELLSINSPIVVFEDYKLEDIFKINNYCIKNIHEFDNVYDIFLNEIDKVLDDQYKMYRYFNESGNVIENYKRNIEFIYS